MLEQPSSADAYSALEQRIREPARALLKRIYHPFLCCQKLPSDSQGQGQMVTSDPTDSRGALVASRFA